jgi:hypothetical protein
MNIANAGSIFSGGKHIPISTAPQMPDTPEPGVFKEVKDFVGFYKRFTAGKRYRADPVPGALVDSFHDLRYPKLVPFYCGAFPHTALGTGSIAKIRNLDNQLTGEPSEKKQ